MRTAVKSWRWPLVCLSLIGLAVSTWTPAGAAPPPISGTHKWAIVLCDFSNQTNTPYSVTYYQQMFSGGGTSVLDFQHYWSDNSYGNLSVAGTTVTGWHTLGITRDAWEALNRGGKRQACGDKAEADGFSFAGYYGFVTIFPEVQSTVVGAMTTTTTSISVASNNTGNLDRFPTPPFVMTIDDQSVPAGGNSETVNVTAVSGTTFTVTRGYAGTTAQSHTAGAIAAVPGDIFGAAPAPWTLGGHPYTLGSAVLPSDVNMTGAAHETGHGFGYNHSRKLSTSTTDYADCFDIMSAYDTCSFSAFYGASNLGSVNAAAGPGITSIYLNLQGWLPTGAGSRVYDLNNSTCSQNTLSLSALNHNEVPGPLAARIPAAITIPGPSSTTTTSDYYWLEYREKNGWDSGLPGNGVVLHLHGADNYAYWVDNAGGSGQLGAGSEFVDSPHQTFVAVNTVDTTAHRSRLTISGCKINANFAYTGDTSGDYHDVVTLAGDLTVAGSGAPIPNQSVTLSLGAQSCTPTTDAVGHASCTITIGQASGPTAVGADFTGDSAYNAVSSTPATFTINTEETTLAYTGDPFIATNRPATLKGILKDDGTTAPNPAGQTVTLSVGSGAGKQTCTGTTQADGTVSCVIPNVNQSPGNQPVGAVFAGDQYYRASSDTGQQRLVFAFLAGGPFVISSTAVSPVTFWSPRWPMFNLPLPWAGLFFGYAYHPGVDPVCGTNWTYVMSPGGVKPPTTLPAVMAVVVSTHLSKNRNVVSGDVSKIVLVRPVPGYDGSTRFPGTGTIVATLCG